MKKSSLAIATLTLLSVCVITAQNKKEEPKTWEEKAAARFGVTPLADEKTLIESAVPTPTAKPKSPRKVLVFYRCEGFIHTSIPYGNHAMQAIADETDAFTVDFADKYDVFSNKNLEQYDAIIFNNTTRLTPNEDQQKAIMGFIESGKGIVGLHAAADNFGDWPEGIAMIGGIFDGHPWTAGGTWAFKLEDPDHVLNASFKKKGLWHKDEIYWYKPENFQGREKLRVLLSLDMSKSQNIEPLTNEKFQKQMEGKTAADVDVPVSWLQEVGDGRLFFTNLGHNNLTFADRTVLQHMLDGIQYAMGDLEADATPSAEVDVKIIPAPDNPE